jgi:hypothetical protein
MGVMKPIDWRRVRILDDATAERLRHMTAAERVKMASDLHRKVWGRVLARVKALHPDWGDKHVAWEACRRMGLPLPPEPPGARP